MNLFVFWLIECARWCVLRTFELRINFSSLVILHFCFSHRMPLSLSLSLSLSCYISFTCRTPRRLSTLPSTHPRRVSCPFTDPRHLPRLLPPHRKHMRMLHPHLHRRRRHCRCNHRHPLSSVECTRVRWRRPTQWFAPRSMANLSLLSPSLPPPHHHRTPRANSRVRMRALARAAH